MNIHPAFVHFPIAFLTLYALLECIPLAKFFPQVAWDSIRKFLLFTGTLALIPTAIAGGIAQDIVGETPLTEAHSTAAMTVFAIFIAASVLQLLRMYRPATPGWVDMMRKMLAVLGFFGLFVVGALGSAIVYGYGVDPIVTFVAGIFGFK